MPRLLWWPAYFYHGSGAHTPEPLVAGRKRGLALLTPCACPSWIPDSVRNNFVLIYELLDEVCGAFPLRTAPGRARACAACSSGLCEVWARAATDPTCVYAPVTGDRLRLPAELQR